MSWWFFIAFSLQTFFCYYFLGSMFGDDLIGLDGTVRLSASKVFVSLFSFYDLNFMFYYQSIFCQFNASMVWLFSEYLLDGSNKTTATAAKYIGIFPASLQNVNFPADLFKMMGKKTRRIFPKFQFHAYNFIENIIPRKLCTSIQFAWLIQHRIRVK